ncbi:MAG: histidine kinase [Bacteroidales bacterium]|nr:histidine kinase [Bacteroidales bacterium]
MKKGSSLYIAPKRVAGILLGIATLIQLVIVSYNEITGFYPESGTGLFLFRWIYSTLITAVFLILIIFPDIHLIAFLNRKLRWSQSIFLRMTIEIILASLLGALIGILASITSHLISAYEDGLVKNIINNALITIVLNIIMVSALEAWSMFNEGYFSKRKAERLEQELSQIRFEVLKSQVNPHFLFNSLNVLSGLVRSNPGEAEEFIDEFSAIYRYVLETIEKRVVSLKEELDFAASYLFLQKIRYGESLHYEIQIDSHHFSKLLPPLSLQTVLENAIKHNSVNTEKPLLMRILIENEDLVIKNNIQPKPFAVNSTGIGQSNLIRRYELVSDKLPDFKRANNEYVARLPLIDLDETS